jgi:hypothetical protein
MKRLAMTSCSRWALLCLLPLASAVDGEELKGVVDPTRPPPGAMRMVQNTGRPLTQAEELLAVAAAAQGASAASSPAASASAAEPVAALKLNAIRFDTSGRNSVALINGQVVKPGDEVAGRTVLSIARESVVMKGPSGEKRLSLLADAEQTRPQPARAAKRGRKESK